MKSRYESGSQKRNKKKREEELTKSLANSMFRYIKKPKSNETYEDFGIDNGVRIENEYYETSEKGEDDENMNENEEEEANDNRVHKDVEHDSSVDTLDELDPANWRNIDRKLRDFLVGKGPLARPSEDYIFPKNNYGRHFSHKLYKRHMTNGDKQDRRWVVY